MNGRTTGMDIGALVEHEFFAEALYFGGLRLGQAPEGDLAELHLNLGLACCGAIKPIAEVERSLANLVPGAPPDFPTGGLAVGRSTTLVYEGPASGGSSEESPGDDLRSGHKARCRESVG